MKNNYVILFKPDLCLEKGMWLKMERVDKTNYYLDIAETISERGTCLRNNYGSVIVKNDEIISSLIIRSGDMIDGILMNTNQSNMILSGGNGGGLHLFDIKQLEEATGKKLNFLGFEGSYAGCVHQIKALFRTSE